MSERSEQPNSSPFLSVVVRPNRNGPQAAGDSLLSLAAQTSQDFEVLFALGDATSPGTEFGEVVDAFEPSFSRRVRYLELRDQPEASILARAATQAVGRYLAVLDLPDVVFGNWVEAFEQAVAAQPGAVVYSMTARQPCELVAHGDRVAFVSTRRPRCPWPVALGVLEYLGLQGASPGMWGFALPTPALRAAGSLLAGHPLDVGDWTAVASSALHHGLVGTGAVTYLRRLIGDDGPGQPSPDECWSRALSAVLADLDGRTVALPGAVIRTIVEQHEEIEALKAGLAEAEGARASAGDALAEATRQLRELQTSTSWRVTQPVRAAGSLARRLRPRP